MDDLHSRYFELQEDMLSFIKSKVKDELKLFRTWDDIIYIPSEFYYVKGEDLASLCYIGKIIKLDNKLTFVGYDQQGKQVKVYEQHEISELSLLILCELFKENNYEDI